MEYFSEHEGYRCGYCKSEDTNYSHGMWAHVLTVQDYQVGNSPVVGVFLLEKSRCLGPVVMACLSIVNYFHGV